MKTLLKISPLLLTLQPLFAGLIWYSPLDGDATATVGANGTASGNPTAVTDRNGNADSAIEFSGSGQYFDLGSFGTLNAGTMAVWAKGDTNAGEHGAMAAGASGGGTDQYFSVMNNTAGQIRVDLDDGISRRDAQGPTMATGTWDHIVTTWSGSGTLRLFINGIQVDTQAGIPASVTMTSNGLLGSERTTERFWDGCLDDAGIWDSEISARQVAALHGLGKFQGLALNNPAINTVAAFSTLGQSTTIGAVTWEYVSGLSGSTGNTGGSLVGEDAFIVLDGALGRGVKYSTGPANPPVVVNGSVTDIMATSATLAGEVTDTGGATTTAIIYWGDNDGGTTPGNWDQAVNLGTQSSTFSAAVSSLSASTTYYFRCFASNAGGSDWANATSSFVTAAPPSPPVVINNAASDVSYEEATINGTVTATGSEAPNVTLYYGDHDGGTTAGNWDNFVDLGAQAAGFSNDLFFLTNGTTYYFRAFAQNSGGAVWAPSTANFTTLSYSAPTLINTPATNITGSAAQVGGEITASGGQAPTVTIYYGDNDGGTTPGSWDSSVILGEQSATFSTSLSGLNPVTTYFFRSYASNEGGGAWAGSSENFTTSDSSNFIINEFMAANAGGLTNNPNGWYPMANQIGGAVEDWIEIHNTSAGALDIGGWHLTDTAANPTKWTFPPATIINGGGYLIVYASSGNAPDANGNLHTNFKLSASGEYLALARPGGSVVSEFGPAGSQFPSQSDDVSYGLHPTTGESVYFTSPTPGSANDASGLARVGDIKFTPDRGYYQTAINVSIASDTPGAIIYYTTNGTPPVDANGTPTVGSLAYSAAIPLLQTTSIRAAAVKPGFAATDIDTHTYVLLDIDNANPDGTDSAGLNTSFLQQTQPAGWGALASGDFNMDTRVSQSTTTANGHTTSTAQTMLKGMRDIPTISISMNRDDFAGNNGIYANSTQKGFAWERACSAEFIPADGDTRGAWQENCGLRVQGGASRNPGSSPKHSLSFRFRAQYGEGKLREALFPDSQVEEFNVIALRAGYNNSWIHNDAGQRGRASMIRDQWARETLLDMGTPSAGEGFMTHVFINGLYWGVHNLCERADASHYASYNGGDENLLDSRNGVQFTDGTTTAWNQIAPVVSSGDWTKIQQIIDINQYIDYQIMNKYGGNADLKSDGNWRAAGGGPFPGSSPEQMAAWELYSWDAERTLEGQTATNTPLDPMGIRGTLETNTEYRIRFADRLQKHLFNNGALTPAAAQARWAKYAADLDRAIIAESARWGDHRITLYTRDSHWLVEQNRLYTQYFPVRTANVLSNYGTLFPSLAAPVFRVNATPQFGGEIPSGGSLSVTGSSTLYYTLDGSDPRLEGGGVSPTAIVISSGSAIPLTGSGLVRTRAKSGTTWSALDEAIFYIEKLAIPGDLVVSEIHYNPYPASAVENAAGGSLPVPRVFDTRGDFEFIEIQNISANALNLDGLRLTQGVKATLGLFALAPGGRAVIVKDPGAFAVRYPAIPIAGIYSGNLDDSGEQIALASARGEVIQDFIYDNSGQWPGRPAGNGSSLEVLSTSGDFNDPSNWRASSEFNGSPGVAGAGPDGRIVINEVLPHTDLPEKDSIEIYNTTGSAIAVGGWLISDDNSVYSSFILPAANLAAGGYLVYDEDDFNVAPANAVTSYSGTLAAAPTTITDNGHGLTTGDTITIAGYGGVSAFNGSRQVKVIDANSFTIDVPFLDNHGTKGSWAKGRPFGLSASNGETLWLLETDVSGRPIRFVDVVNFAASFNGETLGRWPNGGGNGTLVSLTSNTLGSANSLPQVGPVIISEVMYAPELPSEDFFEFIEICNTGPVTENLANWKLRGGADFNFTASHSLAAGDALVVVAFDPVANPAAASAFRSEYKIGGSVLLVGPFTDGPLGNTSGTVRLQRPDSPPSGNPTFYPQVTEDEVIYSSGAPWPVGAAGNGSSLVRLPGNSFGNFATSWTAGLATPGGKVIDFVHWQEAVFGPGFPVGSGMTDDFDGDGVANLLEFALGMNPLVSDPHLLPGFKIEGGSGTMTFGLDLLLIGLSYQVESSTDLIFWNPITDTLILTDDFIETRKASVTLPAKGPLFMRLKVVED